MPNKSEFSKTIEFIIRTDILGSLNELGLTNLKGGNEELLMILLSLPLQYDWNVDEAVKGFNRILEENRINKTIDNQNTTNVLEGLLFDMLACTDENKLNVFNEQHFKVDLVNVNNEKNSKLDFSPS